LWFHFAHGCKSLAKELASQIQQSPGTAAAAASTASTTTAHLTFEVELESHLGSLSDSILLRSTRVLQRQLATAYFDINPLTQRTHRLPLTTLLIKKLCCLSHSQTNDFVLATLSIFLLTTSEHLKRLHSCRITDVLRASLLVSLAVTIKVLVLLDGIVLIDVLVLKLGLLARK
jgi:hypothetical protein